MRVEIASILSRREFGVIFSGTVVTEGHHRSEDRIRVRGLFTSMSGEPVVGETWDVEGLISDTPYGPQMEARRARRVLARGRLIKKFLAAHVPGIGEERANNLWTAFEVEGGEALGDVLSDPKNLDRIAEVIAPSRPLLSMRIASACIAAWRHATSEAALMTWLDAQGIDDVGLARRVHAILGDDAVTTLSANPYVLVPLLSWKRVDALGKKLLSAQGASVVDDARRRVGAADEVVKRTLLQGDTATTLPGLRESLTRLLAVDDRPLDVDLAIEAAVANGALVPEGEDWRAPGAAAMEESVSRRLAELAGGMQRVRPPSPSRLAEILADVASPVLPLHEQQAAAAAKVLGLPVACLTGGAGTGKTYTCKVICDAWERLGGTVLLSALAGKAALRLSRSTRRLAKTLARTLAELDERDRLARLIEDPGASPQDAEKASQRLQALAEITERTLIVVDEASMVDLPTLHSLIRRMPDGSRLLLVGDEAQLPPVGFGLIFHRLVGDPSITVQLRFVHRQAERTGIPVAAAAIRRREAPPFDDYRGRREGVTFVEAPGEALDERVEEIAVDLGIFDGEALIVTATNDGIAGIGALNARLHDQYVARSGETPMRGALGRSFATGERVIFGRNDYRLGLFNGLMGRITSVNPDEEEVEVSFEGEGDPHRLGPEQLLDLDLAYAVTCHKCQGSSARRIVVPVYESRILDPSWLYTAVTRAESQVVLVGDIEILRSALSRRFAAESRRVGFRWPPRPGVTGSTEKT